MDSAGQLVRMEFPQARTIHHIRETAGWLENHGDPCVKQLANDSLTLDEICCKLYRALFDPEIVPSAKFAFAEIYDLGPFDPPPTPE